MKKGKEMLINGILLLGIVCIAYFILYVLFVDLTNFFTYFWLALGLILILVKPLTAWMVEKQIVLPGVLRWGVGLVTVAGLFLLLLIEVVLIGYGNKEPSANADYILVLGAQVKGETPTYALQTRLDVAYDYAVANLNSQIIVSGGKGAGETVTEAYAMAEYLKAKGIDKTRLILEEESRNTHENISYSKQYIKGADPKVVLVTNRFHVYRSVGVARKQGLTNVEGLGSKIKWYTVPNQYVREAFAVLKYKLYRQI